MRTVSFSAVVTGFVAVGLVMLLPVFTVRAAIIGPYAADADTVHLFHFEEDTGATSAANAVAGKFNAIPVNVTTNAQAGVAVSNSMLGATGYTGFGKAANVATTSQALGYDHNNDGVFSQETASVSPDRITASSVRNGTDGSFTVEALINLPTGESLLGQNRYMIGVENQGGASTRAWNFIIDSLGQLNFFWVNSSSVPVAIPTTGPDAFANDTWFHAAFVYDGTAGSSQLYWTKLDGSYTEAHSLGSLNTTATFPSVATTTIGGTLVIGNADRNSAAFLGGFEGLIDEVRISNVARGADEFIFVPEPGSFGIIVFGLIGIGFVRKRVKR